MASMSQVWMLKVSIVIHLIWIYRFCWFYWFRCFDSITLRCYSYLSKQQVWWNDTTTDDICTYFNDEFIVILSNIIQQYFHKLRMRLMQSWWLSSWFDSWSGKFDSWVAWRNWVPYCGIDSSSNRDNTSYVSYLSSSYCGCVNFWRALSLTARGILVECNSSIIAHVEISRKNNDANHCRVSVIFHIMISSWYRMCSIYNSCIIHTDCGDSFARL